MAVRTKTRRRLRNLLIVTLAICILGGGAYVLRKRQVAARVLRDRDAGYAALQAGDYFTALHKIGPFVQKHPDDAESLWKYAIARRNVEEPNGKHISEAIGLYRRVMELQPDNSEAREQLLELYVATRFNTEILSMTENRADAPSLRARAIALSNLGRDADSRQALEKYIQLRPLDLKMQMFICLQMKKGGAANQETLDRFSQLQQAHPDDPSFELLLGFAHAVTGNANEALTWTRKAATRPMTDAELVNATVEQFDRLDQYDDALKVLQQAANVQGDISFRRNVITRLYQSGHHTEVVQRTADLQKDQSKADTDLLAHRAMSLMELKRNDEAQKIIALLSTRTGDFAAAGLSGVLSSAPPRDAISVDEKKVIDACREGLKSRPNNPYFRLYLGDAYGRLGEVEAAMHEWAGAGQIAPVWATPRARILRVLVGGRNSAEVQQLADRLTKLAPDDAAIQAVVAWAKARSLPSPDSPEVDEAIKRFDHVQSIQPGEELSLSLKVTLLAASKRQDAARGVIDAQVRADKPPSPQQTLLILAQASEAAKLGAEQSCLDRCRQLYGVSVQLATVQAGQLVRAGRGDDALKTFEADRAKSGNAADTSWQTAWLRLLDAVSDPRAAKLWAELADAHPDDLAIQQAVLTSRSTQSDRELIRRSIDRLGKVVGSDGVAWRLIDARWTMQNAAIKTSESDREQEFTKAAAILNEVTRRYTDLVPAKLLLSECLFRLNNKQAAAEQLIAAAKLSPRSPGILLQLGSLLQSTGDFERAKPYLDQAEQILTQASASITQPSIAPPSGAQPEAAASETAAGLPADPAVNVAWRSLAGLYAARGETDHAISILRKLDAAAADAVDSKDTSLIELLAQQGTLSDEMCKQLLAQPTPKSIAIVADFYARIGRADEAAKTIAMLDQLSSSAPGEKECIRGLYLRRRGMNQEAAEQLRKACAAMPTNREWWRALIVTLLESGRADEALAAANDACKAVPDDAGFARVAAQDALIRSVSDVAPVRALLASLPGASEANGSVIVSSLTVVRDGRVNKKTIAQVTADLKPLADRAPSLMPLQNLLIDLDLSVRNYDEAVSIATRSMQLAPTDPLPAQRAAESLAAAGRWDQVIPIAREWRTRLGTRALPADQTLAAAFLATRDYSAAAKQIEPYLKQATSEPAAWVAVYSLHAQALVGMGRISEAQAFFEPALKVNRALREAYMELAVRNITDAKIAEQWLTRASQDIPTDNIDEQLSLAGNWVRLSNRSGSPDSSRGASIARLQELTKKLQADKQATAAQWVSLATLDELTRDDSAAGIAYRSALQLNPDEPIAQNNLAMVIVRQGGDLAEAESLATKAAAHADHPGRADFLDTLAQVHSKLGHHEQGAAAQKQAVQLQPGNLSFRINLVQMLMNGGKAKESREAFAELEAAVSKIAQPDPQLVSRIAALRSELDKSSAAN